MAGLYVRSAYQILCQVGRPLNANQIVEEAQKSKLITTDAATPQNTMRARLSDDIRSKGSQSLFQRVGSNRFGLREWSFPEYLAPPFQRGIPDEVTVCVPANIQELIGESGIGYAPVVRPTLEYLAERSNLIYLDRKDAERDYSFKQLIAYVWLETEDGLVFSYTRGKYSSAHRTLLLGRRSVGFGGHVLKEDADNLFAVDDGGLEQAALREIGEELKGLVPRNVEPMGVIWDDTSFEGRKHIGVVLKGTMPHSSLLQRMSSELSINQLRLLKKEELWGGFHAMEFWSQLLIREFAAVERPNVVSSIVPARPPRRLSHIAFVGEIATGKSSIGAMLVEHLSCSVVSASAALRKILGVTEMKEEGRLSFQEKALNFIESEEGPQRLASAIANEVSSKHELVIIDGLRQLTTLAQLRNILPDLVVVYIDCPRDLAFRNYQTRWPGASVHQFCDVREHAVEAELPLFRFEADAILTNADSPEKTLEVLLDWLKRGSG